MTRESEARTMKDVNHTPPAGVSVTNVWQRGQTPETAETPQTKTPADD
ncbi:hypothetical protein SAMN04487950_2635 [Halogranum rubrum]|uniref:Uncharacterized protein n=2 Tax=Halogranum rubrum TaxID=553466 RepID=A0A1I4F6W9_9EURY|nr:MULTISPECIES: hypothetical protein [Halogranum]EJN61513.1 hypothetical protein HSB1_05540 [Halogranum salarium B-1]SFL13040.1 hypothetical protein SAMN04487950_2635 [Halogranum rubrum]